MKISVRRAAALAAGSLMVASLVTTTSAPAQAAPTTPVTPEATAAATWLAGQVTNGTLTNVGQKIDFGAGLVATGTAPQQLATLKTQLDAEVPAWANSPTRTAKAAWFYAYAGTPRADLLASVEDSTDNTTGQSAGSQDFSTLALVEGGSAEAPKAVDYLRSGQCSDGGWGYSVPCDGAGDQFATYYSLAALAGIENPSAAVKTDIAEAVAFLGTKQSANGGFKTCTEYNEDFSQCLKEEEDANDTGLAAWSLGLAGATAPAAKAATWLAAHQLVSLPACGLSSPDAGAISWTDTTYAQGVTAENRLTTAIAAAQGLGGLAYLPASTAAVTAPTGYVAAGSTMPLTIAGLRAGEIACLTGIGAATKITGTNGTVNVTLPAETKDHTVTLATVGKSVTTTVEALGATKFKLDLDKKVEKRDKVKAKIKGLAAGEKVVVRVDGKKVDAGKANANGGFKAVFKATGKAGKAGKRTLTVDGLFDNRSGKATYKVVR